MRAVPWVQHRAHRHDDRPDARHRQRHLARRLAVAERVVRPGQQQEGGVGQEADGEGGDGDGQQLGPVRRRWRRRTRPGACPERPGRPWPQRAGRTGRAMRSTAHRTDVGEPLEGGVAASPPPTRGGSRSGSAGRRSRTGRGRTPMPTWYATTPPSTAAPARIAPPSSTPAELWSTTPQPAWCSTRTTRGSRPLSRGRSRKPVARQAPMSTPVKAMTPPVPAAASSSRSPVVRSNDEPPPGGGPERQRGTRPSRRCWRWGRRPTARNRRLAWSTPVATVPPAYSATCGRKNTSRNATSDRCSAAMSAGTPRVSSRASHGAASTPTKRDGAQQREGHAQHAARDLLGVALVPGLEQVHERGHEHGRQGACGDQLEHHVGDGVGRLEGVAQVGGAEHGGHDEHADEADQPRDAAVTTAIPTAARTVRGASTSAASCTARRRS